MNVVDKKISLKRHSNCRSWHNTEREKNEKAQWTQEFENDRRNEHESNPILFCVLSSHSVPGFAHQNYIDKPTKIANTLLHLLFIGIEIDEKDARMLRFGICSPGALFCHCRFDPKNMHIYMKPPILHRHWHKVMCHDLLNKKQHTTLKNSVRASTESPTPHTHTHMHTHSDCERRLQLKFLCYMLSVVNWK